MLAAAELLTMAELFAAVGCLVPFYLVLFICEILFIALLLAKSNGPLRGVLSLLQCYLL